MNDTQLDDETMKKSHLMRSLNYMIMMMKQNMGVDQKLAQEYYEKVQALHCIMRMVDLYEQQLVIDLDVD
jgi:hypothetical protein